MVVLLATMEAPVIFQALPRSYFLLRQNAWTHISAIGTIPRVEPKPEQQSPDEMQGGRT
jgi:hypothetical protein